MDSGLNKYSGRELDIIQYKLYSKCCLLKLNVSVEDSIETLFELYKLKVCDDRELIPGYDDILFSNDKTFYINKNNSNSGKRGKGKFSD